MIFPIALGFVFPASLLAARLPPQASQVVGDDDCTIRSTLAPVTATSLYPVSSVGDSGQATAPASGSGNGSGSLIYTTALPTVGPDGLGMRTYTITHVCPGVSCHRPDPSECPPGFTTVATLCHVCGPTPVTTVFTVPIETGRGEDPASLGKPGYHAPLGTAGASPPKGTNTVATKVLTPPPGHSQVCYGEHCGSAGSKTGAQGEPSVCTTCGPSPSRHNSQASNAAQTTQTGPSIPTGGSGGKQDAVQAGTAVPSGPGQASPGGNSQAPPEANGQAPPGGPGDQQGAGDNVVSTASATVVVPVGKTGAPTVPLIAGSSASVHLNAWAALSWFIVAACAVVY